MIDEAREAYKRGWVVIPLKKNDKRPNLPIGHEFLTRKPTSQEYKGFEFGNYGVVTGELSGVCVLDVDGEQGKKALRDRDIYLENFWTPALVTPKGVHYYFKWHPKVQTGTAILGKGSNVDIRSTGSYVVGAGSSIDGVAYRWMESLSPEEVELADPPDFMMEHKKELRATPDEDPLSLATPIANGSRNTTLISVGGSLVRRDLPHEIILGVLVYLNDYYMESPLPDSEVEQIARNTERYREN